MASLAYADDPLGLNRQANISFGKIDFEGPVGSGNVQLGSNGTVTYGNNTSGTGLGTPAQLEITGTVGTIVSISCSDSGSLVQSGHGSLPISGIRFNIGAGNVGPYITGTACTGIANGVATHTIGATASDNTLFIGATLELNNQSLSNGTFGTSGGGIMPSFQILVQ